MQFDLGKRMELSQLIRDDILSKWDSKNERIEDFLDEYVSEDIIDYMNATGLKLDWYIDGPLSQLNVIVEVY